MFNNNSEKYYDNSAQVEGGKDASYNEKRVSDSEKRLAELEKKITESERKTYRKIINEAAKQQTRSIEILGIFVALFTFVSGNIIAMQNPNYSAQELMSFILILLGGLTFFCVLLTIILHKEKPTWKQITLLVLSMILVSGAVFITIFNTSVCDDKNKDANQNQSVIIN